MSDSSELRESSASYAPPAETATPEPWSHQWHDQLGLLYHLALAEKIRVCPELCNVAVENIDRWLSRNEYPASAVRALMAWRDLLTKAPLEQLIEAMTDPSEQGHQVRQNTPFAGILTQQERRQIRDQYEKATAR
jgi:hypothetical protein